MIRTRPPVGAVVSGHSSSGVRVMCPESRPAAAAISPGPGSEVIEERIKNHGLWAISLAMMGPPPYPTKVFVISAGVFRMAIGAFLSCVVLGRLLRYGLVGLLAAWLGPTAEAAIMAHYPTVFSGLLVIAGLSLLVRRLRRRTVVVKCSTAASANAATAVLAAGGGVAGGNGGRR